MLAKRWRYRTAVMAFILMMAMIQSPAAGDTQECYQSVLASCNDALAAAKWWQKPAVGILCSGMLAGCVGDGWFS